MVDRQGFGARSGLALPEPEITAGIQSAFVSGLKGQITTTQPLWSSTISEPVVISAEPVLGANGKAEAVASLAVGWAAC